MPVLPCSCDHIVPSRSWVVLGSLRCQRRLSQPRWLHACQKPLAIPCLQIFTTSCTTLSTRPSPMQQRRPQLLLRPTSPPPSSQRMHRPWQQLTPPNTHSSLAARPRQSCSSPPPSPCSSSSPPAPTTGKRPRPQHASRKSLRRRESCQNKQLRPLSPRPRGARPPKGSRQPHTGLGPTGKQALGTPPVWVQMGQRCSARRQAQGCKGPLRTCPTSWKGLAGWLGGCLRHSPMRRASTRRAVERRRGWGSSSRHPKGPQTQGSSTPAKRSSTCSRLGRTGGRKRSCRHSSISSTGVHSPQQGVWVQRSRSRLLPPVNGVGKTVGRGRQRSWVRPCPRAWCRELG